MKSSSLSQPIIHAISIRNTERWSIYRRLRELEIPCQCATNRPLSVELNCPYAIAQLCSVVKQSTASRSKLIDWLEECWQMKRQS